MTAAEENGPLRAVHHTAIWVRPTDVDACLRFYREGLGFTLLSEVSWEADLEPIFDAPYSKLSAYVLGDPDHVTSGMLELVVLSSPKNLEAKRREQNEDALPTPPCFMLISVWVDLDQALARLEAMDVPGIRTATLDVPEVGACRIATVRDPVGTLIELVDYRIAVPGLE